MMAHWAELDENNIVLRVTVGDNNDPNGDEGYQWLVDNVGGTWVKASYNGSIRKRYPGIGYSYDPILDVFLAPKPYPSWSVDSEELDWTAPIPKPSTGVWEWEEETQEWIEI
jgi:hypothetical protein